MSYTNRDFRIDDFVEIQLTGEGDKRHYGIVRMISKNQITLGLAFQKEELINIDRIYRLINMATNAKYEYLVKADEGLFNTHGGHYRES